MNILITNTIAIIIPSIIVFLCFIYVNKPKFIYIFDGIILLEDDCIFMLHYFH